MSELILTIPRDLWMSANVRLHHHAKAERVRAVRALARDACDLEPMQRATIWAFIQYPTARRADAANAYPTVKAAVDGLIDAGLLPDDNSDYLSGPYMVREQGKSPPNTYRLRLLVTEWSEPWKTNP